LNTGKRPGVSPDCSQVASPDRASHRPGRADRLNVGDGALDQREEHSPGFFFPEPAAAKDFQAYAQQRCESARRQHCGSVIKFLLFLRNLKEAASNITDQPTRDSDRSTVAFDAEIAALDRGNSSAGALKGLERMTGTNDEPERFERSKYTA